MTENWGQQTARDPYHLPGPRMATQRAAACILGRIQHTVCNGKRDKHPILWPCLSPHIVSCRPPASCTPLPLPLWQQSLTGMCQSPFQSNMAGEPHSDRRAVMCLTTLYSDPALHVTFNLFLSPCVYLTESAFRRVEQEHSTFKQPKSHFSMEQMQRAPVTEAQRSQAHCVLHPIHSQLLFLTQPASIPHPTGSHPAPSPVPPHTQSDPILHPINSHPASSQVPSVTQSDPLPHPTALHLAFSQAPSCTQLAHSSHPASSHPTSSRVPFFTQLSYHQHTAGSCSALCQVPSHNLPSHMQHPARFYLRPNQVTFCTLDCIQHCVRKFSLFPFPCIRGEAGQAVCGFSRWRILGFGVSGHGDPTS